MTRIRLTQFSNGRNTGLISCRTTDAAGGLTENKINQSINQKNVSTREVTLKLLEKEPIDRKEYFLNICLELTEAIQPETLMSSNIFIDDISSIFSL